MNRSFRLGLVVGKFSPLHRGHELVIRHALDQCERVVVISYVKPEIPGCEAQRREHWLAELFPSTCRLVVTDERLRQWLPASDGVLAVPPDDAEDLIHRRFVGSLCRDLLGVNVDVVFTSEDYGEGFAAELTDFFRRYQPSAPRVRHVLVDRERKRIPVSGTKVRSAVHLHRDWLSPTVYASFVQRICLLGGESSGKSTLAESLAKYFGTVHVPEYGRELWEARAGVLHFVDLRQIAEHQVAREEQAARRAVRYLFCDTSPLTTLLYSQFLFNQVDPVLEEMADRAYDLTVLCEPDFAFVQDGTRQVASFRLQQHAWYRQELGRRGIYYLPVTGRVPERVAMVAAALEKLPIRQ
jgi:HTH-type transcriptional regulator, transcriptional repressor of NAD biosynthesis genes